MNYKFRSPVPIITVCRCRCRCLSVHRYAGVVRAAILQVIKNRDDRQAILGDPGAASRDDWIFTGERLVYDELSSQTESNGKKLKKAIISMREKKLQSKLW